MGYQGVARLILKGRRLVAPGWLHFKSIEEFGFSWNCGFSSNSKQGNRPERGEAVLREQVWLINSAEAPVAIGVCSNTGRRTRFKDQG